MEKEVTYTILLENTCLKKVSNCIIIRGDNSRLINVVSVGDICGCVRAPTNVAHPQMSPNDIFTTIAQSLNFSFKFSFG